VSSLHYFRHQNKTITFNSNKEQVFKRAKISQAVDWCRTN
jgi:hypothetical protein